ncbi:MULTISPECIES: YbfB/YjiJ family MFS transporter [Burkholderia]|uniref:YbfB/YjiJ family MFS transporter n=1 Tax=Burkholderia TaxID=32008 RepID=UPI001E49A241|nr:MULTISPECIES: YbfB/YjiJ family MFS transporter [unclassified Burkholderia]
MFSSVRDTGSVGSAGISPPAAPDASAARRAALACAVALAVALGIGRFAFTPLLPLMLAGGGLDIRHGGWLASANYAGYFVGAITCARIRAAPERMVRGGLAATVALLLTMSVASPFWIWALARFAAGAVSAWTFVFASQWGLTRIAQCGAPAWGGVIYTGPGAGIVATGLAAAALAGQRAALGWSEFAMVAALLSAAVWRTFAPCAGASGGARDAHASMNAKANKMHTHRERADAGHPVLVPQEARARAVRRDARWLVLLYGLPGFGYIITATFLPVIARAALPAHSPWPDLFWPMFGAAVIAGALLGAKLPPHWNNRLLLAACCGVQAVGVMLGIVWPTAAGFALGSILVGLPFTAITLFAMREARRLYGERAVGLMGYATASYGLGQIAGPLVAAPLAARAGSFSPALWLAAAVLVAAAAGFAATVYRGASADRCW